MPEDVFTRKLSLLEANYMIQPILNDEIKNAMFSIGNYKAPGSDGFSSKFFKAEWDIVGRDVEIAIHNFFYRVLNGLPRCAFKIDIKKAYDTVDWRFLIVMLQGLGFHPVLVKWIRELVSTISYPLAINGNSYGFFHGGRGLRQGDPLSPYLFTIVMEGFSMLLKHCIREAADFGYHRGCDELDLTHLCFADDLFVFTKGDVLSVEVLKKALFLFQSRSGLAPSLEKSEIYFGNARLKLCDYAPLIAKVKGHILNWKSKFLSFGGRRQLIISVLQSLQLHWMSVFLFPSGVIHDLESTFWKFLWAPRDDPRGRCRLSWDEVGDGRDTNAWEDGWLSCGHLSAFISYRFVHSFGFSTFTTVRDLLMSWEGVWPDDWSSRFAELHSSPLPLLIDSVRDRVLWGEDRTSASNLTVSNVWALLEGSHPIVPWHKAVWLSGHIPKHAFCLWLACQRRLPTQDRMLWKDEPPDLECLLCRHCMDSHSHLFFQCSYAHEVLETISDSSRRPKSVKKKLALAASVFYIWQERNRRLFTEESHTTLQLIKVIMILFQFLRIG
ncbi:uncharacterized protein LOC112503582 [Cynara cardunculus var. scolymus]|uniref:uncharacterized protein LOC112503582 n=1 Tax=Cynara cardunculus var. scolymus TaxID=59895 RepID=UPI000D62F46C|nr:uncharacterized protein LOC112503582 [Cynara cardunculus var. scolymus]